MQPTSEGSQSTVMCHFVKYVQWNLSYKYISNCNKNDNCVKQYFLQDFILVSSIIRWDNWGQYD